jgi:protein-S-isoprenylcysteine O-methyltransferase Ste14
MAGAIEARHAAAGAPRAAPATAPRQLAAARARLLGWQPAHIALALAGGAAAAHLALWGLQAAWGLSWAAAAAGTVVAAAGLAWRLWAQATFRAATAAGWPADAPRMLVDEGPYRYGRHPMYLGTVALLLGAALGLGAPLLALAAAVFAGIVAGVHVPHEEAQLLARFGGWYRDYAGSVRRWL